MLLVRVEILVLLPTELTDIAPSFCKEENTQSNLFSSYQHIYWLKSGNAAKKTNKKKKLLTYGKEMKKFKFGLFQKGKAETKRVMQRKKMVIFI